MRRLSLISALAATWFAAAASIASNNTGAVGSPGSLPQPTTISVSSSASAAAVPKQVIRFSASEIELDLQPGHLNLTRGDLIKWINSSAKAVTAYFGRFPVHRLVVHVVPVAGRGIRYSTADSDGTGGVITLRVGSEADTDDLRDDWVLTHEMVHLGFPLVEPDDRWLAEGMATYVEPLARLQSGTLSRQSVWRDLIEELPKGLPQTGDRGLFNTHTWGRTYWGGALFWLLADINLRKETENRFGVQDAFRAILSQGGNITSDWTAEDALKAGDKSIGGHTLMDLYMRLGREPVTPDLELLWERLGVKDVNEQILFSSAAPLYTVRRAIELGHAPDYHKRKLSRRLRSSLAKR